MPLLFIRYFWLFGPICWMWTLFLIATEVCVCYISSFHVELAQKAARYLPSLSRWDFSPLHSHLTKGLPGQIVVLPFAPIKLISAFWEKIMLSTQYFMTCSAVVCRVIQPRACLVLSGGCRHHFLSYSPRFKPTRKDYIQFNHL